MKYDSIGKGYNTTRKADPWITGRLSLLLNARSGGKYLDIGCGTGNYTIALAGSGLTFFGVDPSQRMMDEAKAGESSVQWKQGSAESIPFGNRFFDGAIATLTMHHWTGMEAAFAELVRVMKPQARLVVFTSTPDQMKGYWLNEYFPVMLHDSIAQMPSQERITEALRSTAFVVEKTEKYFVRPDLEDGFLYIGKTDPERYFDENIRKGISSFAALAHQQEVNTGLMKLRSDMETGNFESVRAKYENDRGDYLFLVLKKDA